MEVLDPTGVPRSVRAWSRSFTSVGLDSLAVDPQGNAVVVGAYESADAGEGYFVVKLGP